MTAQDKNAPLSKVESLALLEKQRQEINAKIEQERAEALAEIVTTARRQAEAVAVSLDELIKALKDSKHPTKPAKVRASAPAKYRNPKNHAEEWSGRGKKPVWVVDNLEAGGSLESLAI